MKGFETGHPTKRYLKSICTTLQKISVAYSGCMRARERAIFSADNGKARRSTARWFKSFCNINLFLFLKHASFGKFGKFLRMLVRFFPLVNSNSDWSFRNSTFTNW